MASSARQRTVAAGESAAAGLTYDRLIKVVNGYRDPRPDEVRRIAVALSVPAEEVHQTEVHDGDARGAN